MTHPLDTLIQLNDIMQDLDMIQDRIIEARLANPLDQEVQLELDRRQTAINIRRTEIELTMLSIATMN